MKKTLLFLPVIVSIIFLSSCAYVLTPVMGGLYTDVTAPVNYVPGNQNQQYQILGEVEGTATANSVFGIIATGDASVYSAYKNALSKKPGTDNLIDVMIDYKGNSFLGLFASYTTIVRGKAVKYASASLSNEPNDLNIKNKLNKGQIKDQRRNTNNKKRKLDVSKEDMEKWKEDVLAILNSTQGNHLWMQYIKEKNVKKKPEQWVSELTEENYEDFTNSKTPIGFWLAKKLRQETK